MPMLESAKTSTANPKQTTAAPGPRLPPTLALSSSRRTLRKKHSKCSRSSSGGQKRSALFHVQEEDEGDGDMPQVDYFTQDDFRDEVMQENDDLESVWASLWTLDDDTIYTTLTEATYGQLIDAVPKAAEREEETTANRDSFHHGLDKDELMSMVSALTMDTSLAELVAKAKARNRATRKDVSLPPLVESKSSDSIEGFGEDLGVPGRFWPNITDEEKTTQEVKSERVTARKKKRAGAERIQWQPVHSATSRKPTNTYHSEPPSTCRLSLLFVRLWQLTTAQPSRLMCKSTAREDTEYDTSASEDWDFSSGAFSSSAACF